MYRKITEYRESLEKEIKDLGEVLKKSPKAKLLCARNGRFTKWYVRNGTQIEYLPKKKRKYAITLARAKYAEDKIKALKRELYGLSLYEKHHANIETIEVKYLGDSSPYRELLIDEYKTRQEEFDDWMNADYDRCTEYQDNLVYDKENKLVYRSKSESLIEIALIQAGIPFRYECALEIGGKVIYPDFTILRPSIGKIVYWEHFGMMDDPAYIATFKYKIELYASAGIYLGEDLYATYETKNSILTLDSINSVIKKIY